MLIGFHARKQGGKDTAYERLTHLVENVLVWKSVPVERVSFADLLYRSAAAALGVTVEELYEWKVDPDVRIEIVRYQDGEPAERGYLGPVPFKERVILHSLNFRQYLQFYGTEAHRDIFGQDFWVDAVEMYHEGRIVAVTDARFVNEAEAIREYGGVIVSLIGPPEVEHAGDGHDSEKPLPPELIDFVIDNSVRDDGFQSLDHQLRSLVAELRRGEP